MKTKMIILAAPSGAGKSTFIERILKEEPRLVDTVTFTTRSMREGESEGHPYHFVSNEKFHRLVAENYFVEWAEVHRNFYGTPLSQLEEAWRRGKCIIMDVDIQGARTFKAKYPEAVSVFILPPSIKELRQRIIKRDPLAHRDLDLRLQTAEREIAEASTFDHRIINDRFEESYQEFKKLVAHLLD